MIPESEIVCLLTEQGGEQFLTAEIQTGRVNNGVRSAFCEFLKQIFSGIFRAILKNYDRNSTSKKFTT